MIKYRVIKGVLKINQFKFIKESSVSEFKCHLKNCVSHVTIWSKKVYPALGFCLYTMTLSLISPE